MTLHDAVLLVQANPQYFDFNTQEEGGEYNLKGTQNFGTEAEAIDVEAALSVIIANIVSGNAL